MNDQYMWGDDVPGSGICSFTYDSIFQFWKNEYEHAPKGNPMRLQLAANTVVEDNLGSRVLEIGEDGVKTYRDDVREVHVFDGPAKNGKHMFFLNSGAYLIRSTDPECETAFDFDTEVVEDMTLYAKWKLNEEEGTFPLGDVDGDGKVDIFDASSIQKSIAGTSGYPDYSKMDKSDPRFKVADVDKDGKVDIFDASLIQKYIAGNTEAQTYGIGQPM